MTTTTDPYRWLEADDADVLGWQRAQAAAAAETVGAWPHLDALTGLLGDLNGGPPPVLPVPAAGRWFRADGAALIAAAEPLGSGETVARLPAGERAAWLAPSPDGTVLAVGVGLGGGEENAIRLLDAGSGEPLGHGPDRLLFDALLGGVGWLPDSSGFYYLGLTGPVDRFEQAVFRYDLRSRTEHAEPIPLPAPSPDYTLVQPGDGRWAVAAHGLLTPLPMAVRDRSDPDGGWRPFLTAVRGADGPVVAGYPIGDEYVAWTDVGAPRGRVVAIRFDADDPGDPAGWRELLPEGDGVIVALLRTRAALYTVELVDGRWSRVRELDGAGGRVLPLPPRVSVRTGVAALHALARPAGAPELLLPASSPSRSWTVSGWRPGDAVPRLLADAATGLPGAVVEERQAVAADGTLIPYTCLYWPDERGPRPTLITAYGGFCRALTPEWSDDAAAVAASGGLHVWAHTRGGGELGREWWEGGRREHKQTVLDDLHAVAADLVATGRSDPARLAVVGRSHGGWLAGAAAVTRPDVWRVAVPLVPALDLVTDLETPYGRYVTALDWPGDDAEERVAALSPYHLIRPGSYPAVYLAAGDRDPRCPAWHARKFAARLQEAQQGPGAVLLRVRENAGHGLTSTAAERQRDAAEWLGFVFAELGLVPPRP